MMLAKKLPYFNTKILTLKLANLELGGFKDFPFILFQCSSYLFIFENFDFMTCNDGEQKHAMKKE
jgi:hypothetical protein